MSLTNLVVDISDIWIDLLNSTTISCSIESEFIRDYFHIFTLQLLDFPANWMFAGLCKHQTRPRGNESKIQKKKKKVAIKRDIAL